MVIGVFALPNIFQFSGPEIFRTFFLFGGKISRISLEKSGAPQINKKDLYRAKETLCEVPTSLCPTLAEIFPLGQEKKKVGNLELFNVGNLKAQTLYYRKIVSNKVVAKSKIFVFFN